MPKKRKNRPYGHYCKICGEYKANEKFSSKGHSVHICKACSKLSAAEKAERMTLNRLENMLTSTFYLGLFLLPGASEEEAEETHTQTVHSTKDVYY